MASLATRRKVHFDPHDLPEEEPDPLLDNSVDDGMGPQSQYDLQYDGFDHEDVEDEPPAQHPAYRRVPMQRTRAPSSAYAARLYASGIPHAKGKKQRNTNPNSQSALDAWNAWSARRRAELKIEHPDWNYGQLQAQCSKEYKQSKAKRSARAKETKDWDSMSSEVQAIRSGVDGLLERIARYAEKESKEAKAPSQSPGEQPVAAAAAPTSPPDLPDDDAPEPPVAKRARTSAAT